MARQQSLPYFTDRQRQRPNAASGRINNASAPPMQVQTGSGQFNNPSAASILQAETQAAGSGRINNQSPAAVQAQAEVARTANEAIARDPTQLLGVSRACSSTEDDSEEEHKRVLQIQIAMNDLGLARREQTSTGMRHAVAAQVATNHEIHRLTTRAEWANANIAADPHAMMLDTLGGGQLHRINRGRFIPRRPAPPIPTRVPRAPIEEDAPTPNQVPRTASETPRIPPQDARRYNQSPHRRNEALSTPSQAPITQSRVTQAPTAWAPPARTSVAQAAVGQAHATQAPVRQGSTPQTQISQAPAISTQSEATPPQEAPVNHPQTPTHAPAVPTAVPTSPSPAPPVPPVPEHDASPSTPRLIFPTEYDNPHVNMWVEDYRSNIITGRHTITDRVEPAAGYVDPAVPPTTIIGQASYFSPDPVAAATATEQLGLSKWANKGPARRTPYKRN